MRILFFLLWGIQAFATVVVVVGLFTASTPTTGTVTGKTPMLLLCSAAVGGLLYWAYQLAVEQNAPGQGILIVLGSALVWLLAFILMLVFYKGTWQ